MMEKNTEADRARDEVAGRRSDLDRRADRAAAAQAAKQALHDLAARGRARASPRSAQQAPLTGEQLARDRNMRLRRTVSMWAGVRWWLVFIVLLFPTISISTEQVSGTAAYLVPVAALLCCLLVPPVAGRYADWRVRKEWSWAGALPYELVGYPRLLEVKPGRSATSFEIRLEFVDGAPGDLMAILRGFDPELEESRGCFVRDRPAEIGKIVPFDLNRRVRRWVRRFVPEVLTPLHTAYRLRRVELRLVPFDD